MAGLVRSPVRANRNFRPKIHVIRSSGRMLSAEQGARLAVDIPAGPARSTSASFSFYCNMTIFHEIACMIRNANVRMLFQVSSSHLLFWSTTVAVYARLCAGGASPRTFSFMRTMRWLSELDPSYLLFSEFSFLFPGYSNRSYFFILSLCLETESDRRDSRRISSDLFSIQFTIFSLQEYGCGQRG